MTTSPPTTIPAQFLANLPIYTIKTSYPFDETLLFLKRSQIGLNRSNLIDVLHLFNRLMGEQHGKHGRFLCDLTDKQLHEHLPYLSLSTVGRTLKILGELGLIKTHIFHEHVEGRIHTKRIIEGIPIFLLLKDEMSLKDEREGGAI